MYSQVLIVFLVHYAQSYWFSAATEDPFLTSFHWVQDDPLFDCIAPITYYKQILNCGTFVLNNLIVTSSIPLENIFKNPTYMKIYTISDVYNLSTSMYGVHSVGDIWGKKYFWVHWGYKRYERNPVHDLMFIYVPLTVGNISNAVNRVPYYIPVAKKYAIEEPSGWKTAAFALTDYRHVTNSTKLVPIYWEEPVLVDCQEYFPKYWGYFICILNIDKYPVIHSGAPLIHSKRIWGIACFSLRRGKDSIFAYTDLRPYRRMIYGFYKQFFATTAAPLFFGK